MIAAALRVACEGLARYAGRRSTAGGTRQRKVARGPDLREQGPAFSYVKGRRERRPSEGHMDELLKALAANPELWNKFIRQWGSAGLRQPELIRQFLAQNTSLWGRYAPQIRSALAKAPGVSKVAPIIESTAGRGSWAKLGTGAGGAAALGVTIGMREGMVARDLRDARTALAGTARSPQEANALLPGVIDLEVRHGIPRSLAYKIVTAQRQALERAGEQGDAVALADRLLTGARGWGVSPMMVLRAVEGESGTARRRLFGSDPGDGAGASQQEARATLDATRNFQPPQGGRIRTPPQAISETGTGLWNRFRQQEDRFADLLADRHDRRRLGLPQRQGDYLRRVLTGAPDPAETAVPGQSPSRRPWERRGMLDLSYLQRSGQNPNDPDARRRVERRRLEDNARRQAEARQEEEERAQREAARRARIRIPITAPPDASAYGIPRIRTRTPATIGPAVRSPLGGYIPLNSGDTRPIIGESAFGTPILGLTPNVLRSLPRPGEPPRYFPQTFPSARGSAAGAAAPQPARTTSQPQRAPTGRQAPTRAVGPTIEAAEELERRRNPLNTAPPPGMQGTLPGLSQRGRPPRRYIQTGGGDSIRDIGPLLAAAEDNRDWLQTPGGGTPVPGLPGVVQLATTAAIGMAPPSVGGTAAPGIPTAPVSAGVMRALDEARDKYAELREIAQQFGVGVFQAMSQAVAGTKSFGDALKDLGRTMVQSLANQAINTGVGMMANALFPQPQAAGGQAQGGARGAVGQGIAGLAGQGVTRLLMGAGMAAGPAGLVAGAAIAIGGSLLGGLFGGRNREREEEQFRAHLRALRQAQMEQLMNFTIVLPSVPINPNDPAWKEAVSETMRSVAGTRTGSVEFITRR